MRDVREPSGTRAHLHRTSLGRALGVALLLAHAGCIPPEESASEPLDDVLAQQVQSPSDVVIGTPTWTGSGCPAGTMTFTRAGPDLDSAASFTLNFAAYNLSVAASGPVGTQRRDCTIRVPVEARAGRQLALAAAEFVGLADLAEGTVLHVAAEYGFDQFGTTHRGSDDIRGPHGLLGPGLEPFWSILQTPPLPEWSACGAKLWLRIDTHLVLEKQSSQSRGVATFNRISGALVQPGLKLDLIAARACLGELGAR